MSRRGLRLQQEMSMNGSLCNLFQRDQSSQTKYLQRRESFSLEPLENRLLLSVDPLAAGATTVSADAAADVSGAHSIIVWDNRGSASTDSDNFTATYGANATAARAIVDRAINDWEHIIVNFNYAGGGNTYHLTINAADLGDGGRGVTTGISFDASGKPTSATITMDDDGGGANWFFDTT